MTKIIVTFLSIMASLSLHAGVISYTNIGDFNAATMNNVLVEDFEGVGVGDQGPTLNLAQVTATKVLDGGNIYISSTGQSNFGLPTASQVLTGNGEDKFEVLFNAPSRAVGFDTYVNAIGTAETVSIYGASGLLDTFSITHSASVIGFFGAVADEDITKIRFITGGGRTVNAGIDNIIQAEAVPEPNSLGLLGIAFVGLLLQRKRNFMKSV